MQVNFGGVEEKVVTRGEFPLERSKQIMGGRRIVVLGYGSQGPGQSQNLRDNGYDVIVGQRRNSPTWEKALKDGWVPGENLFDIYDAIKRANRGGIVANLLSDAAQMLTADEVYVLMEKGQTAYFSHGFGPHFSELTGIRVPKGVNSVMVAPKGAGLSVRRNFLNGSGINSSYAVQTNATGDAEELALAMGIGIGSGYLFETTMEREVVSDHFGERAILLGGTWALAETRYNLLRTKRGMSPEEAFVGSSEQITQIIFPRIGAGGIDELLREASKEDLQLVANHRDSFCIGLASILNSLYDSCAIGIEAQNALDANSKPGYREGLNKELQEIRESEMWKAGERVRMGGRDYSNQRMDYALAGQVLGFIDAQTKILLENGHSPSEAFNETVEETTQSLNQFYQAKGVAHLLEVCSTTAQRGALDWGPKQIEVMRGIKLTGYDGEFENSIWEVGKVVRGLRPERQK